MWSPCSAALCVTSPWSRRLRRHPLPPCHWSGTRNRKLVQNPALRQKTSSLKTLQKGLQGLPNHVVYTMTPRGFSPRRTRQQQGCPRTATVSPQPVKIVGNPTDPWQTSSSRSPRPMGPWSATLPPLHPSRRRPSSGWSPRPPPPKTLPPRPTTYPSLPSSGRVRAPARSARRRTPQTSAWITERSRSWRRNAQVIRSPRWLLSLSAETRPPPRRRRSRGTPTPHARRWLRQVMPNYYDWMTNLWYML